MDKIFQDIKINIKKSKRKTLSIYIERDGTVSVLAPITSSEEEIEEVIKQKKYRIHKYLAEWDSANSSRVDREYVNGQSFLYFGRNYRLELVDGKMNNPLILKNGYFLLRTKDKLEAQQHFIDFYKDKGISKILERVEIYKNRLDVSPNEIRIMELKNRWASCSSKGNLNFHWKCIMAPLDVISYIVVHELVHLKIANHTNKFWNEIDKIIPDYRNHIEWLKSNGAAMDL